MSEGVNVLMTVTMEGVSSGPDGVTVGKTTTVDSSGNNITIDVPTNSMVSEEKGPTASVAFGMIESTCRLVLCLSFNSSRGCRAELEYLRSVVIMASTEGRALHCLA
jgi:hypothetical protein